MYHHRVATLFKLPAFIASTGLFLMGCEPVIPSIDVPTAEVYVDYKVSAYEGNASHASAWYYTAQNPELAAAFYTLDLLSRVDLDLGANEISDLSVNGQPYPMRFLKDSMAELNKDPRQMFLYMTSPIWYIISELNMNAWGTHLIGNLPVLNSGDKVDFTFRRSSGEVMQSWAIIGEYPVVTLPLNNASIGSEQNEITVAWNALPVANTPVRLNVGVRCSQDFTWTEDDFVEMSELSYDIEHDHTGSVEAVITNGATSYVVSRQALLKDVVVPSGVSVCGGTITFSYASKGVLAPEFRGGDVEVTHYARKVEFLLNL